MIFINMVGTPCPLLPFGKGRIDFSKFLKKGGVLILSIKRKGLVK